MLITLFGVASAATMVVSYGLEARGRAWIAVFAAACLAVAAYGAITGAWVFAVLEVIWAAVAMSRFRSAPRR